MSNKLSFPLPEKNVQKRTGERDREEQKEARWVAWGVNDLCIYYLSIYLSIKISYLSVVK